MHSSFLWWLLPTRNFDFFWKNNQQIKTNEHHESSSSRKSNIRYRSLRPWKHKLKANFSTFGQNAGKYGPENKTPNTNTFHTFHCVVGKSFVRLTLFGRISQGCLIFLLLYEYLIWNRITQQIIFFLIVS